MQASASQGAPERLRELDGWRAVSVLLVAQQHLIKHGFDGFLSRHPYLAHIELYIGVLGVKVFFVISGFIICRLLLLEEARDGIISLKAFYYRRVFRILPPFLLYLGTVAVLVLLGVIAEPWWAILGAALFLSNIHIWPWGNFMGHTWSLAVEEQFYLTFPFALVLTPKKWRTAVMTVSTVCLVIWSLSMIFTGWESAISGDVRTGFICISCGVLMAVQEEPARKLARSAPAILIVLLGLILLVHPVDSNTWQGALYESLLVPLAIGLILLFSLERGRRLRAVLCSPPFQIVGMMSYGIYLWQQFFTVRPGGFLFGRGILGGHINLLLLPLIFVIVPISYYLIEKPAMRYGRKLSDRARRDLIQARATPEELSFS